LLKFPLVACAVLEKSTRLPSPGLTVQKPPDAPVLAKALTKLPAIGIERASVINYTPRILY
jgi:hypothetical protein